MEDPTEFDDPAFRAAVRRAAGAETAPARLRRRVSAAMTAAAAAAAGASTAASTGAIVTPPTGRAGWLGPAPLKTLAIAAVTLVAVGFAVLQIMSYFGLEPGAGSSPAPRGPVAFPQTFAAAVIMVHDNCAKLPDHHVIPGVDPAALREPLSKLEGIPVFATSLGDSWQFRGASLCQVEGAKAAHLLFARGGEMVSIFSLPAPASCQKSSYSMFVSGHPLAGFTRDGTLYCVVGSATSGKFTLEELEPVMATVLTSFGVEHCEVEPP
ncbi:MAG: hypothetical protein ABIP55_07560 [Tepidisphaeraceae bacterium]